MDSPKVDYHAGVRDFDLKNTLCATVVVIIKDKCIKMSP